MVIASAISQAGEVTQERQKYTVLLILTDGIINDMDETIAELVTVRFAKYLSALSHDV